SERVKRTARPVIIGDLALLLRLSKKLGLKPPPRSKVINLSTLDLKKLGPGRPTIESSKAMISYIEEAVHMAVNFDADALVTGPINKESAKLAGFKFPGHTEFIAHLTGAKDFSMMLGGDIIKVVLVTIHEPIKKVSGLITIESVLKTIKITDSSFKKFFGLKKPRIAVCGLNPHAGEGGLFGDEEIKIILPAINKARSLGINAIGPLPPDTVFFRMREGEFDCAVCMYHDQGLIPLKLMHFENAVNVTLGLPIIRTSVDHGTAYDIAWKGKASAESMIAAIETAAKMAGKRLR
ncbi:MAG: 4-hydroxythreonine-4-phosphate dehydrogenase PdxA, partial [Thermodesulfobacteriota bacterium]